MIDSHAHLDMPEFATDLSEVLERATNSGVSRILSIGIDTTSSLKALELATAHAIIIASAGIHPSNAKLFDSQALADIAQMTKHPEVVAVGEIGLDYYRDYAPREKQKEVFSRQLELAAALNLPVIIHCRQAEEDLLPLLSGGGGTAGGVIHCFSGNRKTADKYLKMGLHLSLGCYITYPSSKELAEVVKELPLDRLLTETDCPFLPPQGKRGQRNEPSYVTTVVAEIARIKGISVAEVDRATSANAIRLFKLA